MVTDGAVGVAVGTMWLQPAIEVAVGTIVVAVEPVVVLVKIKIQDTVANSYLLLQLVRYHL
jgi:hypothetical protein